MNEVSFILTSCGRMDLLKRTMDSFMKLNTYPIQKYFLHEDGGWGVRGVIEKHGGKYFDYVDIPFTKRGLSKALDHLLSLVETEFVFTCEDDWLFKGNPDFIFESVKIMNADKNIHHVWIRKSDDHQHPLGDIIEIGGVQCRKVLKGYQEHWGGFSFNPGLRRMSDIKRFFPNGISEFGDEAECSKHVESIGYNAVSLVNSSIVHIGWGRHSENFMA